MRDINIKVSDCRVNLSAESQRRSHFQYNLIFNVKKSGRLRPITTLTTSQNSYHWMSSFPNFLLHSFKHFHGSIQTSCLVKLSTTQTSQPASTPPPSSSNSLQREQKLVEGPCDGSRQQGHNVAERGGEDLKWSSIFSLQKVQRAVLVSVYTSTWVWHHLQGVGCFLEGRTGATERFKEMFLCFFDLCLLIEEIVFAS